MRIRSNKRSFDAFDATWPFVSNSFSQCQPPSASARWLCRLHPVQKTTVVTEAGKELPPKKPTVLSLHYVSDGARSGAKPARRLRSRFSNSRQPHRADLATPETRTKPHLQMEVARPQFPVCKSNKVHTRELIWCLHGWLHHVELPREPTCFRCSYPYMN